MRKIRVPAISPIKTRKEQIERANDKIRAEAATKTRRHFKTAQGFEDWKPSSFEKIMTHRPMNIILGRRRSAAAHF